MELLFLRFAVLIMSVVIHEVCHGIAALMLGDSTAKMMGRLTLNPVKHVDLFGFVILPLITFLAWGFPMGAAKPVPYNPYNLRNQTYGSAIVGAAGPGANFFVAVVFGFALRFMPEYLVQNVPPLSVAFSTIVFLNLLLGVFNLLPVPPLDGSKVFVVLLPDQVRRELAHMGRQIQFLFARYWVVVIFFFIFFGPQILRPLFDLVFAIVSPLYSFLVGASLQ